MITIAGGTGTVGAKLTSRLLDEGRSVRVLTRNPAAASALFGTRDSLELVEADVTRPAGLADAFRGSTAAFLSTGTSEHQVRDEKALIDAALEAGVPWLVNLSVGGMSSGTANPVFDWHREIDAYLEATGVAFTHVRPATFTDTLVRVASNFVPAGAWGGHTGAGLVAPIDTRDVAAASAAILLAGPREHAGRSYELTGPAAITMTDLAALLSDGLGTEVVYHDRTAEQQRAVLTSAGLPQLMVGALLGVDNATRDNVFASPTAAVRELTGQQPLDPGVHVKENLDAFAA